MALTTSAVAGVLLFGFSLISRRIDGTMLTAPMLFAAAGFIGSADYLGVISINVEHGAIHVIAELTLVLVLFSDAARINFRNLRRSHNFPVRMLIAGLPLSMLLGTGLAIWLFPHFKVWEAALLAALLAPTDAALGQVVVSAKTIPLRIRQTINIESGLNDGIALPVVLALATLSSAIMENRGVESWLTFAAMQLIFGPLVGLAVGHVGAKLLDVASAQRWASIPFEGIATLSLALLAFILAELVNGNGFISAFVAGAAFGHALKVRSEFLFEFMEGEGQLLMLLTFLAFGSALLPEGLDNFEWVHLLYALLSLTVIRMLPISLSLLGSGIKLPTHLFLGWFGPRGLASILFLLLIFEQQTIQHQNEIFSVTVLTVALSIFFHGLTAAPFARMYSRYVHQRVEAKEHVDVTDMPLRDGSLEHR